MKLDVLNIQEVINIIVANFKIDISSGGPMSQGLRRGAGQTVLLVI